MAIPEPWFGERHHAYEVVLKDLRDLRDKFDAVIEYFERIKAADKFAKEYEAKAYPNGFCGLPDTARPTGCIAVTTGDVPLPGTDH